MRVHLKGTHTVRKTLSSGREVAYHYAWRGGPRLKGEPGTPEFVASYNAAIAKRKQPPEGAVFSLIATFRSSREYLSRAPRTQLDYAHHLKTIENEFGTFPLAGLSDKRARGIFKGWRDKLALKSLRQADYAWSVLARVFSVALDRGMIEVNPCLNGGRLYKADRTEAVWNEDEETAFLERAPRHLHLALILALWTGQRQGDLLNLTWSNYDGRYIRLRQGKTRRKVTIPVGAPLKAALDAEKAARRGALILLTIKGTRWTANGFSSSWRKACARVGIAEVTFHDTRGTAVTRLAAAGATEAEIATITGLALSDVRAIMDAHYLSRDIGLADSAIAKLETRTIPVNRPVNQST